MVAAFILGDDEAEWNAAWRGLKTQPDRMKALADADRDGAVSGEEWNILLALH